MLAQGEWWCSDCGKHNYRGNLKCKFCVAPRRIIKNPRKTKLLEDGFKARKNHDPTRKRSTIQDNVYKKAPDYDK
jgi:hypothetical protein